MPGNWEPIDIRKLRVGHYVRIGHSWLEHPFARNSFLVETPRDLALIRRSGLTRVFVDAGRSRPAPESSPEPVITEELESEVTAEVHRLETRKAAYATEVRRRRAQLLHTRRNYETRAERAERALALLRQADSAATGAVEDLVRDTLKETTRGPAPLTYASSALVVTPLQRLACQSLDAMALAIAVGRRMGIAGEELEVLAMSALLHGVGLTCVPPELRDENRFSSNGPPLAFQDYPLHGVQMLRECGAFPPEVLQVVRQHRERPDGSGFPEGASSEDIHKLATIVGVVREFQVLAQRTSGAPAAALAHLYRNLRGVYGATIIDNLIAAVTVYPPGSWLALNDGSTARVMRVSEHARLRPTVCLYEPGLALEDAEIVDLTETDDLSVARVLGPRDLDGSARQFFRERWAGYALGAAA